MLFNNFNFKSMVNMSSEVTGYINQAPESQRIMMENIRTIIHDHIPGVTENFKWGRPVFSASADLVYLKTSRNYLTLGFFKYQKITTNSHLLEGTGKDMRHIKLKTPADLNPEVLVMWLGEMKG